MIKILIADDNEIIREMICESLEQKENILIMDEAKDGIEAEEKILSVKPDIVLVDLVMPGLDGIGLVKKVKNNMKEEAPLFIMVSSVPNETVVKKAFLSGVSYYFMKPFNVDELVSIIEDLYESRNKRLSQHVEKPAVIKNNNSRNNIEEILFAYGIPRRVKGFDYILRAVEIVISYKNISESISKQIYYTIAREFNTKYGSVERNIRYAIECGFKEKNTSLPEKLQFLKEKRCKNMEFIVTIASYIKNVD